MMKKLLVAFVLLTVITRESVAQLGVVNNNNPTQLAQVLAGPGVVVSNATLNCPASALGTFNNGGSTNLGVNSGVALTTGTIGGIPQAATAFASTDNANGGDAQLNSISGAATQDVCVLEFDIVPVGNSLNFDYVFGSEEYPEYVCSQFNDVFGFFISGPNPGGGNYLNSNIALIPSTGLSVAINTVNPGVPGAAYNASGCTSLGYAVYYRDNLNPTNPFIVYDGMTTVLNANISVTPCATYHLKLAIGDAGDGIYDSGVFIEASSFTSTGTQVTAGISTPGYTSMFEGCVDGFFTITLPQPATGSTVVNYTVTGTGTNGIDYNFLSGSATVPNGQTTVTIPITPTSDGLTEGTETVTINIINPCDGSIYSSATLNINDLPDYSVTANPNPICEGASSTLTVTNTVAGNTFAWSPSTGLSSTTGNPVTATPPGTTTYYVNTTTGSCVSPDSITLTVAPSPSVVASSNPNTTVCTGSFVQLDAAASGGTPGYTYTWSGGSVSNPNLQNPTTNPTVTTTYTVLVTDANGCTATSSVTVNVVQGPQVSIGSDQNLCWNEVPVTLTPNGGPYQTYTWSTGETTSAISVDTSGSYNVTVFDGICQAVSNTVVITVYPQTHYPLNGASFCDQSSLSVCADQTATNILWSTGATTPCITISSAGSVYYTADDVNGCLAFSDTADFTVIPLPQVSITATDDTICPGFTSVLTANAPTAISYLWSTGESTSSITVSTAGTYSVTVDDGTCTASASYTVYEFSHAPITLGGDQQLCFGQTATLSPSGGPYVSYLWSTGETTATIVVSADGDYWVQVNDGNCFWNSDTVTITIFPLTTASLPDTGGCLGDAIVLSTVGGLSNIEWSTGATTGTITVTVAGDYWYTATDGNGCPVNSDTSTVTFANPPAVNADASPDTICPGSPSLLTSNAQGNGTLTYLWTPTGETTADITVTQGGTYIVQVSDGFCSTLDTVVVEEFPNPDVTIGYPQTVCAGDSVTYYPSGGPWSSYLWSDGSTADTLTTSIPGNYWVQIFDGTCFWNSDTVTLDNFPPLNSLLPDTGACLGDNIVLSTDAGAINILWSTGETTVTITVSTPGDYWYTATDGNGCVVNSDTATVTFDDPPTVNATASEDTICPGSPLVLDANATGTNLNYYWTPTGETTATITVTQGGTYIVRVGNGFCYAYDTVVVEEFTHAPITLGPAVNACVGDSVQLSPSGGPYVSYLWSNGATTDTIWVSAVGDYWVQVNDGVCNWNSDTVHFDNYPVSHYTLNDTGACTGVSITLFVEPQLSDGADWSTGVFSTSINVTVTGDYWYTAFDNNGCLGYSDTATVSFFDAPVVNAVASPDTFCDGSSSVLSSNATGTGTLTYLWSPTGETTADITVANGGTYIVEVSNGFCSTFDTVTVVELPAQTVTLNNDSTVCPGNCVTVSASGGPWASYNWSNGATTATISACSAGDYSVTVNDGFCNYVSDTFTLSNFTVVNPLAHNDTSVCTGTCVDITADPGYFGYVWSNGSQGTIINVCATGDFSYTAVDANGCPVQSDTATVSVLPQPTVNATATPDTICPGGSSLLNAGATGATVFNWLPGGEITPSITVTSPGTYIVTVGNGSCSVSDTVEVYQHVAPEVYVSNDTTVCPGQSVVIDVVSGTFSSYLWNTGDNLSPISVSTPGNYWVTVNDGNCSYVSDTFTLSNFQVASYFAHSDTTVCAGTLAIISSDPDVINITWNTGATTSSITVGAGFYWYSAADDNGCSVNSDTVQVSETPNPTPNITANPPVICANQGGSTVLDAGSVVGIGYTWTGGATTPTITVTNAGTYFVTANDNGCLGFDSITIAEGEVPVISLQHGLTACCASVTINTNPDGSYSYLWSDNSTGSTLVVNSTNNGTQTYSVTATSVDGCSASASTDVTIRCINAIASALPDTVFYGDSSLLDVLTDYSSNLSFVWVPAGTLSHPNIQNPFATPMEETKYTVFVMDTAVGCSDTAEVTVYVIYPDLIAMPNAFTPNGDGHNDGFYPVLLGAFQVVTEFRIYDRWGALIHNGPEPWNGDFKGAGQPAGTYIYYVVVRVPDDENIGATKDIKLQGSFSLLR